MINLNTKELLSSVEASLLWGKQKDYVRTVFNKYPHRFPEGSIRKFGKQIIVTREGMENVTKKNQLKYVRLIKTIEGHVKEEKAEVIGIKKYRILIRFKNKDIADVAYNDIKRAE